MEAKLLVVFGVLVAASLLIVLIVKLYRVYRSRRELPPGPGLIDTEAPQLQPAPSPPVARPPQPPAARP
eukprot:CAMPEP_0115539766 /NCGR_PEP_ID=MMETSP0271-20121206/89576_1 /TAXON_ID=71861 /ORGANISM="Scrippsiella trochoidea, Strain CCMP3099" /LENGTH=68 /DNA_ID=CAMNT_0002972729 /DNA_START=22 /DNA_END=225 /DNA_ORIENTATION=+